MTGVCSNMEPSSVLIAIYITALLYGSVVAGIKTTGLHILCVNCTMF
jgi:hypothetical protein